MLVDEGKGAIHTAHSKHTTGAARSPRGLRAAGDPGRRAAACGAGPRDLDGVEVAAGLRAPDSEGPVPAACRVLARGREDQDLVDHLLVIGRLRIVGVVGQRWVEDTVHTSPIVPPVVGHRLAEDRVGELGPRHELVRVTVALVEEALPRSQGR